MRSKLFDKYFPIDEEVEDENERDIAKDTRERLVSLVASAGWPLFKDRMELVIEDAMDIKAGPEAYMLQQIGYKDGLLEVRKLMNTIQREITAGRNDV